MRSTLRKRLPARGSLSRALRRDLPGRAEAPVPGPFPGRWPTVVSLVAAPLLLLAGELVKAPHHFFFPEQIAAYADHPDQLAWGYGLWLVGQLALIPAFVGLATSVARTRPVLGTATGLVCLVSVVVTGFTEGANFVLFQLADAHSPGTATDVVGHVYSQTSVGYVLAWTCHANWVLLAVALLSTRVVGPVRALALALVWAHPSGVLKGFTPVGAVVLVLLCVVFVTLAVRILRHRGRFADTA
ncbi:hypothetical protein [Nocardiopsis halotolerans]|uniref:hypothetical protein n=1 Tax=Nocardiopsis halotolerans TaxID=124252 RepID=UPI00034CB2BE|nr:hypothetical protein [Nocardiopsis halotolerans]